MAAAYSLDAQTGVWSRWFAGKPDVSNMPAFSDIQGVLALGPVAAPVASPTPVATPTPGATPVVTPTATPTAPGEGPELGTYSGTTSQGKPIEFDVVEGSRAIGRLRFEFEGACGGGCTCDGTMETTFSVTPVAVAVVNSAFSHSAQKYHISGEFNSTTTASGDLEYRYDSGPYDPGCDSGPLTWTASLQ